MATTFNDSTDGHKELENYTMSVGISFVNAYYKQLGDDPAGLGSFFAADSAFTWSDSESTEPAPVSFGRDAIVQRLKQLKLEQAKVGITSVTCQPSANNAVLVQVVGDITPNVSQIDQQFQFAQVFYLVKVAQKFRYYCYNDCFRYIAQVPQPEPAPVNTQQEETTTKAQAAPPVSPQRHESSVLDGSDPIVTTSHPAPSAGVIGPATSTSSTASSASTSAAKEGPTVSPNLGAQFTGGYSTNPPADQQQAKPNDWAAEEDDEETAEPVATPAVVEPTPAPTPTPAPATATRQPRQEQAQQAAPGGKKGWATVQKTEAVPIAKVAQQQQAAAVAAAAQEESEEEDAGKPVSFLEAIKRKQRKAAQAGPVVVQAPVASKPAAAGWGGQESAAAVVSGRAKLAQDRKEYEAREAAARRPREQPERRPRTETPRFGVFVGKMPSDATEKEVIEVFSAFGPVANVRIPQGKRVAFVDFQDQAGRDAAIAATGAKVNGQTVVITEPQVNPNPAGGQQGGQGPKQGGNNQQGGKPKEGGQGPRPKAGAKTGGK